MLKKFLSTLLLSTLALAQINFVENYTRHITTDSTVRFYAGTCAVEFKFVRSDIVKVTFFEDSNNTVEDASLVVIQNCDNVRWSLSDANDKFLIETDSILIRVDKFPLRIYYYDKAGKLLLKERNSGGFGYSGREKYVFFEIQPDEHFYGQEQALIRVRLKEIF